MRSPNNDLKSKNNKLNSPFQLGENHILKRFRTALNILLTSEYYEGTELGKIYNEVGSNGKSKIYVDQPELETKLQEEFLDEEGDITKYLVGYTGVGKTTLIRNFFGIFNRDIIVKDNNLLIYISFYSMIETGKKRLEKSIIEVMELACTYLSGVDYRTRLQSYNKNDDYYWGFYEFINNNNRIIPQSYPNSPKYTKNIDKKKKDYKIILDFINKNSPLDYTLCQLKYNLHLYEERTKKTIKNVVFIFDDIEAKPMSYQNKLIQIIYHIKKCLQAFKKRSYSFKTLITLRYYSFRLEQIRAKSAFREINKNDIILKSTVPSLSNVINQRFQFILEHEKIISTLSDIQSYKDAKNELDNILIRLYGQYDKMLLSLTHYNIFESMNLLMRILTNKKYIGKYEKQYDGAFVINRSDYNFGNNNLTAIKNADVFYALVYGENDIYEDQQDYYLTNIMHYKEVEKASTEIVGLYVIQYLITKGLCMADVSYDGIKTMKGKKILKNILEIFDRQSEEDKENMAKGIKKSMKHLYEGGVLLQSIFEPKRDEKEFHRRNYTADKKIYLSLRGIQLYNMLKANSLLFETYRDDIDTELEDNDKRTMILSKLKRIEYCLNYSMELFGKEAEIIRFCSDKALLENTLGDELVTYILLHGICESINIYFHENNDERTYLIGLYNQNAKRVNQFIEDTLIKNGTRHRKVDYLDSNFSG